MSNKIVVLGAGESGVGAALLARKQGLEVFVSDKGAIKNNFKAELNQHQIPFEEKTHSEEKIFQADEVIKSPGIPDKVPLIQALRSKAIPIISEIEFAARFTQATLIGITGTNGKTTTTALTEHILKQGNLSVKAAGNIGNSFARELIQDKYDYYVLEISSFQLDDMQSFHPHIAVILNITPDHLDRYNYDLAQYAHAKLGIIQNQSTQDHFIYDASNLFIQNKISSLKSPPFLHALHLTDANHSFAFLKDQTLFSGNFQIPLEKMALQGPHNYYNSAVAIKIAQILGLPADAMLEGLATFSSVVHRLEKVQEWEGVTYINDSKATNVEAVYYALESFDRPIVWIAGGIDKGNDYKSIQKLIQQKVKALISLGTNNENLETHFRKIAPNSAIYPTQSMPEAVQLASKIAQAGDVVLLSPACASFDLFKNYEDRGNQFKESCQVLTSVR